MPSVKLNRNYDRLLSSTDAITDGIIENDPRWQTVNIEIARDVLRNNFAFLDSAVLTRGGKEGVPYMTTTGLYGPIMPGSVVSLKPDDDGNRVVVHDEPPITPSLIDQLDALHDETVFDPDLMKAVTVSAKWISVDDGGAIGGLSSSSNVFGATGQLLMKEPQVEFPVLLPEDPRYAGTLAYYGGKLLGREDTFSMGFDLPLFGIEYSQVLPDYIADYAMQPYGGGGLFVEHHQFPHIWLPRPPLDGRQQTVSRILLGRFIDGGDPKDPQYHFTVFHVPSDGCALTIRPGCIHNDSYTQGPEVVFLAHVSANTVAIRKTTPFTELHLNEGDPELLF